MPSTTWLSSRSPAVLVAPAWPGPGRSPIRLIVRFPEMCEILKGRKGRDVWLLGHITDRLPSVARSYGGKADLFGAAVTLYTRSQQVPAPGGRAAHIAGGRRWSVRPGPCGRGPHPPAESRRSTPCPTQGLIWGLSHSGSWTLTGGRTESMTC
jgi:hypothetical protein